MRASRFTLAPRHPAATLLLALPLLCAPLLAQSTPQTTPQSTPTATPSSNTVILSEAHSAQSKDPKPASPIQTAGTLSTTPPQASTPAVRIGPGRLTIHMLNAKSGKPMRHYALRVEYQGSPQKTILTTDKEGIAHLDLPAEATAISLIAISRKDHPNEPAYTVCGPFGQFLPIADILAQGFVPQNACSNKLHLTPHPAEAYYLIEPLPWYNPATE